MPGTNRLAKFFANATLDDRRKQAADAMADLNYEMLTLLARCRAKDMDDGRLARALARAVGRAIAIAVGMKGDKDGR